MDGLKNLWNHIGTLIHTNSWVISAIFFEIFLNFFWKTIDIYIFIWYYIYKIKQNHERKGDYYDGEEEIEYVTDMESAVAIRYATLEDYENNGFSTFGLTTNIQKIR